MGPGAFGDEPAYRGIDELARDVDIVKRAGIQELALFDLAGVVRRGNVDTWLDACARSRVSQNPRYGWTV